MTRLYRTRHHLGQERLIGHVRSAINYRHLGFATAELFFELSCSVEARISTTDDQYFAHIALQLNRLSAHIRVTCPSQIEALSLSLCATRRVHQLAAILLCRWLAEEIAKIPFP